MRQPEAAEPLRLMSRAVASAIPSEKKKEDALPNEISVIRGLACREISKKGHKSSPSWMAPTS